MSKNRGVVYVKPSTRRWSRSRRRRRATPILISARQWNSVSTRTAP